MTAEPLGASLGISVVVGVAVVGEVFSVAFSVVEGVAAGASGLVVVSLVCSRAVCCSCSLFKTAEVWKAVGGGSEGMVIQDQ